MSKISVLSPALANMIAAGEVVERPSSIVKELVENSIDANSKEIEIRVKDAGRSLISVRDDGDGMDKEDVLLAFTRHATSKIKTERDLFRIGSLGFRGEALPSIAAVSKVDLKSSQGSNGWKVHVEETNIKTIEPSDARKGTEIEVRELFYNTPARLKHLKSDQTELGNIIDTTNKIALAHPDVRIKLYNEDKLVFQTNGNGNLLEIIATIYGYETAKNMIPVNAENMDFKISGFVSKFNISKASRKYMVTILNGRSVRMLPTQNSIVNAYRNYIPSDRYPIAILNIESDFQLVDVNVHPSKNEVRLSKEDSLSSLVENEIATSLKKAYMVPEVKAKEKKEEVLRPTLNLDSYESESFFELKEDTSTYNVEKSETSEEISRETTLVFEQKEEPKQKIKKMNPIGQIHGTYIVAESEDGFYLIDQHAAAERINFEKFSTLIMLQKEYIPLLIPKVVELSFQDIQKIKDKMDLLKDVGIDAEVFGNTSIRILGVPVWMKDLDLDVYVSEIVEQILRNQNINIFALRSHAVATMACKASLKANKRLSYEEQLTLIENLLKCANYHTCPHGRPTMIFYSTYEIEKLFKRTGF